MPATIDLDAIAHQIKTAQDAARQIAPLTSQFNDFDVAAAYAVADRVHRARLEEGAIPLGRKIGFTNPEMWERFGVREPVWGFVYDETVVQLSGDRPTFNLGGLAEPKLEPELVLHFRAAPPAGGTLPDILECVDWIAHGFEIVQCHFPGWKFEAPDAVADSALHGALLLGERRCVDLLGTDLVAALASFSVELMCNEEVRETGKGSNVLGSPLAAIAHLTGVLAKQLQYAPIRANELVTTGTLTSALSIRAGETWRTRVHDIALPGLCVTFVE